MIGTRARLQGAGRRLVLALAAFIVLASAASAGAQVPVPALQARVTDTTGTLSPSQRGELEAALADIERRKGSQVAILMVPSTQPEPIEQFALRVAESWRLGRGKIDGQRVDDGLLIVVAKNDRRIRIEVGYGLEGAIPDALAKRIIAERITPRFREGDFHAGLAAAVQAIGRLIDGEALPAPGRSRQSEGDVADWLSSLVFMAFVGMVASAIFGRTLGSLIAGGGGALALSQAGAPLALALAAGLGLFFVVIVIGAIRGGLGRVGRHTYRSRPPVIFPPSGGWGGGFGGGSGGGFGGGGGGFGGGGASGDW